MMNNSTDRAELQAVKTELARVNTEYHELISAMQHDFGAPIRHIKGFSRLLESELNEHLNETNHQYFGFISKGAEKMQRMVEGMTAYARQEVETKQIQSSSLDHAIQEALQALSTMYQKPHWTISIEPLPKVLGESNALKSVFFHLLHNSIHYQPENQNPVISVSAKENGPFWQILVKDNGIGIPNKMHKAVFKAFKRSVIDKEYLGLGMGLAVAQKYVHQMGGYIEIIESDNTGTTVAVNLAKVDNEI